MYTLIFVKSFVCTVYESDLDIFTEFIVTNFFQKLPILQLIKFFEQ